MKRWSCMVKIIPRKRVRNRRDVNCGRSKTSTSLTDDAAAAKKLEDITSEDKRVAIRMIVHQICLRYSTVKKYNGDE